MQDELVADVERRQDVLGEGRRGVDDDEVVVLRLATRSTSRDRRAEDAVGLAGLGGAQTASSPLAGCLRHDRGEALLVEVAGHADHVDHGPFGQQLEADRHVAEGEVEVDEQGPAAGWRRGRRRGWSRRWSCPRRPWPRTR